jgi:hypothetical protein
MKIQISKVTCYNQESFFARGGSNISNVAYGTTEAEAIERLKQKIIDDKNTVSEEYAVDVDWDEDSVGEIKA